MMLYPLTKRIHQQFGRFVEGSSIWEREWDILCILDGCRVDTFREFYPGTDSYHSVASTSKYWLLRTFGDRELGDVGYVSANPFASELDPSRFGHFHLEPVKETDAGIETVAPERLRDHAIAAWHETDIEKLIVHFMQPHVPFRSRPEWFEEFRETDTWGSCAWGRIERDIDRDEWFAAYADNLAWVLEDGVEPLRTRVDATVGMSADHGNAAGEWGLYGHPKRVAVPSVRRVPWLSFVATDMAEETPDVELSTKTLTERERENQLKALGYL